MLCRASILVAGLVLTPIALAQPIAKPIVFDVVSVKVNKTDAGHPGSVIRPDGLDAENIGLMWVMYWAYGFADRDPNHFSGVPDWVKSERVDIIAKVAPQDVAAWNRLSIDERVQMFRGVLEDRFKTETPC
jgi:uncharacterized protein (TIGR03435 family)